ncbi:MAG: hypothetical protein MGF17_11180 [Trichodesmium sp. MAG_R04]|jgi:hypothetical protein|nr:hypothetical protein [Trichodesmium sp. MAG_R04]
MSVFIAKFDFVEAEKNLKKSMFTDFLPFPPSKVSEISIGRCQLIQFSFEAALDRDIVSFDDECFVAIHGYGSKQLENRVYKTLRSDTTIGDQFSESFCALVLEPNRLIAFSSITGVEQFFIYETTETVYVTNRHNLLSPFLDKPSFSKKSFMWMVGRGHIGDFGFFLEGIYRTKPNHKYVISKEATKVEVPNNSFLFEPLKIGDVVQEINSISEYFAEIINGITAAKSFSISGGKDSRAILGMLDRFGITSDISLSTHGEAFAPDVMAATDLVKCMGLDRQHIVNNNSPKVNTSLLFSKKIAKDITLDFIGSSLSDFKDLQLNSNILIGGHENGFKKRANKKSLEQYIASRRWWLNNLDILGADAFELIQSEYTSELQELLSFVPVNRYSQVDLVNFRTTTFVASNLTNFHISQNQIHPFLDGRFYRLLCGVPDTLLDSQFIHYLLMRNSSYPIEAIPFANDEWPQSLYQIVAGHEFDFRDPKPVEPYRFNQAFPSQKGFGLYEWRIQLAQISTNFTKDYIISNRSFFDFINYETFNSLMDKPVDSLSNGMEIMLRLSLFKVSLLHHFGTRSLNFSHRNSIATEVESLIFHNSSLTPTTVIDRSTYLEDKLSLYEGSIASMARKLHRVSQSNADNYRNIYQFYESLDNLNSSAEEKNNILSSFGLRVIPPEGIEIFSETNCQKRIKITGKMLKSNLEGKQTLLVAFVSNKKFCPPGFVYSDAGAFYFSYLGYDIYPDFSAEIEITQELDFVIVKIMPWYNRRDILISTDTIAIAI